MAQCLHFTGSFTNSCQGLHEFCSSTVLRLPKNELTSTCVDTVPQLSAHNYGIIDIPVTITHCSPHSIDADLHPASTLQRSINQTNCFIGATWGSCGNNYICSWRITATQWQLKVGNLGLQVSKSCGQMKESSVSVHKIHKTFASKCFFYLIMQKKITV